MVVICLTSPCEELHDPKFLIRFPSLLYYQSLPFLGTMDILHVIPRKGTIFSLTIFSHVIRTIILSLIIWKIRIRLKSQVGLGIGKLVINKILEGRIIQINKYFPTLQITLDLLD